MSIFSADFQIITRDANDDRESRLKKCSNRGVFLWENATIEMKIVAMLRTLASLLKVMRCCTTSSESMAMKVAIHAEKEWVEKRRIKNMAVYASQRNVFRVRKKYQERIVAGVRKSAKAFGELKILSNRPS